MRHFVSIDPESTTSSQHWAIVFVPKRTRGRFPASCVETVSDQDQAITQADPINKRFAASVIGPSKSSEGQYIYYLVRWLSTHPD